MDKAAAFAGWWPYRCGSCGLRFHKRSRNPRQALKAAPPEQRSAPQEPRHEGPAMAFRADAVKPQAKVVIAADSHEQLNQILLALQRAISSYQHKPQAAAQEERTYSAR